MEPLSGASENLRAIMVMLPKPAPICQRCHLCTDTEAIALRTFADRFLERFPKAEQMAYLRNHCPARNMSRWLTPQDTVDETLKEIASPHDAESPGLEVLGWLNIQLLVIDAEGHERSLISALDFKAWSPQTIFCESHNLFADKAPSTNWLPTTVTM